MANDHQLSAEQIQSFLDDGYLIVPHLFDQEEADLLLAAAQADPMMKDHTLDVDDRSGRNSQITVWNHPSNDIWGMVSCSHRVVDAMEGMLGAKSTIIIPSFCTKNRRSVGLGSGIRITVTGIRMGVYTLI